MSSCAADCFREHAHRKRTHPNTSWNKAVATCKRFVFFFFFAAETIVSWFVLLAFGGR